MRQAIVDETAGVTRDRHYGRCEWCGTEFSVVDTGGYTSNSDDIFEEEIRKQVVLAIEEAHVVLFMVEAGTGDLLDAIVKELPAEDPDQDERPDLPHFTIVGKPNVGKSSLTNALLGKERNIVTPIAGTTRDSIATLYNKFGHEFMLVDTAGMRKKTKVHEDLEFYSVMRSIRAIEHSDVCILMIDAQTGIEAQDMAIFNLIQRNKKGCVVVVNKWDTVEKDSNTMKEYTIAIKERLAPFNDLPIIFTSVINKQRIMDVLDAAAHVYENYSRKISTSKINEEMLPEIENYPPPAWKGKYIKIKYITQLPTRSPSFAFFCNLPQYIREPYRRFLENKLRSKFDFLGCPVQIFLRQK
jgi:GTP-binding protein